MYDVYVGIGSNIDAESNLLRAIDTLSESYRLRSMSSVYRSPAYGFEGDDFLNLVIGLRTAAPAEAIDETLSAIEYSGGRRRGGAPLGPRTLDLDLLIYAEMVRPELKLPRDDILRYPFVLAPIAEIAPRLKDPLSGREMLAAWTEMSAVVVPLERIGDVSCLRSASPADTAPAVDGEHLPGDIRRVADQK